MMSIHAYMFGCNCVTISVIMLSDIDSTLIFACLAQYSLIGSIAMQALI